jgi:hypothetical protein
MTPCGDLEGATGMPDNRDAALVGLDMVALCMVEAGDQLLLLLGGSPTLLIVALAVQSSNTSTSSSSSSSCCRLSGASSAVTPLLRAPPERDDSGPPPPPIHPTPPRLPRPDRFRLTMSGLALALLPMPPTTAKSVVVLRRLLAELPPHRSAGAASSLISTLLRSEVLKAERGRSREETSVCGVSARGLDSDAAAAAAARLSGPLLPSRGDGVAGSSARRRGSASSDLRVSCWHVVCDALHA